MEITETKKYELTRMIQEPEKLKIFFMCIKENAMIPNSKERFVGVVGYRHEQCIEVAKNTWIMGTQGIVISHGDFELIENILKVVNCEGVTIVQTPPQIETPIIEKPTKEQFVARLKLAAEEMIEDEIKRKQLIEIINTIKI